jgi:integrase
MCWRIWLVLLGSCPTGPQRLLVATAGGVVATAGGAGLRWGEVAGLCEDAIDLDAGPLKVIRTVVEVSGNTSFKAFPKSAAGRRAVPLPP